MNEKIGCVGKTCHVWDDKYVTKKDNKYVFIVAYDSDPYAKFDLPFVGADHRRYAWAEPWDGVEIE